MFNIFSLQRYKKYLKYANNFEKIMYKNGRIVEFYGKGLLSYTPLGQKGSIKVRQRTAYGPPMTRL